MTAPSQPDLKELLARVEDKAVASAQTALRRFGGFTTLSKTSHGRETIIRVCVREAADQSIKALLAKENDRG